MNYKLCELYNKYTILSNYEQNTHFIQIAPCFRGSFHCFGMLQLMCIYHTAVELILMNFSIPGQIETIM